MTNKEKEAYWKGRTDGEKPRPNALSELLGGGNYKPPSGEKEAYREGFKQGKKNR